MKYFSTALKISVLLLFAAINLLAESEPNNTYQSANTIGPNATDSGTLYEASQGVPADDYDWWKVTLPSYGSLYVEANASGGLTDVELYIYDIDGARQISSLDISTGPKEATHKSNLKAGTYYIRASRYSGSGTYSIKTVFVPALYNTEAEPNDSYSTALNLNPNSQSTGNIGYYSDNSYDYYDFWKVTIPYDGSIKIRTESDSCDIDLAIYDVNGESQIAGYDLSTGLNEETHRNDLKAGTYYIRAFAYSKFGSYKIICTYVQSTIDGLNTNDNEPNDAYTTAINLGSVNSSIDYTHYGHLGFFQNGAYDYYDWWAITTLVDGAIVFNTESNETMDIDLAIYDINGESQIAGYDLSTGKFERSHKSNLAAGKYYLRAYAYWGYGSYRLKTEFKPAALANDSEPNDQATSAAPISLDVLKTGHLGYFTNGGYDYYDFYSITIGSMDTLYVRTDTDSTLEVDMALYNTSQQTVTSAGSWGTKEIMTYAKPQAGTYYIRVYAYSGYGSYGIKATTRYPGNPVTGIEKNPAEELPTAFELYQNYPNPFNPETTIKYDVPQTSNVSIKVYDILGNEVATLANEIHSPGSYSVKFSGANLASGIYFYRITAGDFTQVKKLMLMK